MSVIFKIIRGIIKAIGIILSALSFCGVLILALREVINSTVTKFSFSTFLLGIFIAALSVIAGLIVGRFIFFLANWIENYENERRWAKERIKEENEELERVAVNRKERQNLLRLRLGDINSNSLEIINNLHQHIDTAKVSLDKADVEFREGAFAPFWDFIEEATRNLASFESAIRELRQKANQFKSTAMELESNKLRFLIDMQALPDARSNVERLRSIVRLAQKNFHFASIYEQRKTNQLLIEGFSTLGQAINGLGDQISDSLYALESSVSDLHAATREQTSQFTDEMAQLRGQMSEDSKVRQEHEQEQREMLDNIQRKRKPLW